MDRLAAFELRRQIDGLVYRFDRVGDAYRRADRDLWITKHPDHGWVAWDDDHGLTGRPWAAAGHGEGPPEGIWVSRKGPKSYVYDLVYLRD